MTEIWTNDRNELEIQQKALFATAKTICFPCTSHITYKQSMSFLLIRMLKRLAPAKLLLFAISLSFMFCVVVAGVQAETIYTLSGNITHITDNNNILAGSGINVGDAVTYTYLVDYNRPGSWTSNDGTVTEMISGSSYSYYFADLLSPTYITGQQGWCCDDPDAVSEYNYLSYEDYTSDYLMIGSGSVRLVSIYPDISIGPMDSWVIGQLVDFSERVYLDDTGSYDALVESTLRLDSITIVPEPVSSLLFLAGGSLLAGRRLLRKKKIA